MKLKFLVKFGVALTFILISVYILFLILPFVLNIFIDKYIPSITGEINRMTGLSAGLEDVKVVTTPKLTAGLKVGKFELYTPNKEPVFISDNFQVKMSLLPLLAKNIRIDTIQLNNTDIILQFDKDGSLLIEKYLPEQGKSTQTENDKPFCLPFGLKLSNHLPDIHINTYKFSILDGEVDYVLSGGKTDLTNFILNKSIKISANGKFALKEREQFKFDIKLFNKIMPEIDINELVFNSNDNQEESKNTKIDIITPLKKLYEYNVTANATANLNIDKDKINGDLDLSNLSILNLPFSKAVIKFNGNSIDINSDIYTAKNEVSQINGQVTTGKKPYINMNIKTDAESENILNIAKNIALIFNIKELQTLMLNGKIQADFNIKSDFKTLNSSGFLKVLQAKMYYGLYKIGADNINANINFNNNNVDIKNTGFTILGQPLKLYGTVSNEAICNIHLIAEKLNLKGLLVVLGQQGLLKDNNINSGTVSMDAHIQGKLDKINPVIKLNLSDINIKNVPTDITLKAPSTIFDITSDCKTFEGNMQSNDVMLINPVVNISAQKINADIKEKSIKIMPAAVKIEKNNVVVSGTINDFLTDKINLDFVTSGDIKSTLKGYFNPYKMILNLNYYTTEQSTMVIPMFDKSKMSFNGKININGDALNPVISGQISVPNVSIPEIPVEISGMDIKLYDKFLHGSFTARKFISGGIKAENLIGDFILKGLDFYLNNLKGESFNGKITGNIIYNLLNCKTSIEMSGTGMNAEKTIEGCTGIKKALTGTLNFKTKLGLTVVSNFNDMMKTLSGSLDFKITNGAFGSIGRFEGLLNANNIITNTLFKNTVASISNATGLATTAQFDTLDGKLTFSNGYANLNPITSAGKSLCYYINGKYNLINGTTNVIILGRLDAPMVAKLGVLGDISADKVLGKTAGTIFNIITANPYGENISAIPSLTNGSTNYKDFKVSFNGGLESKSSIKSFKWLSKADMSNIETKTIKESVKDIKSSFDTDIKTTVTDVNKTIEDQKQKIQTTKQNFKDSADELKNLFKSIKQQPVQKEAEQTIKEEAETIIPASEEVEQ